MSARKWKITDLDGGNPRMVTLAEYRAEVSAAARRAKEAFTASAHAASLTIPSHFGCSPE